MHKTS